MKTRITLLLLLIAFLLLTTASGALPPSRDQGGPGTLSGGNYRLTTLGTQAVPVSGGGAYRLTGPSASGLQGSGCCCTYLPCMLRDY